MKKIIFIAVLFLCECDGPTPHVPKRYGMPPRVITIQVTVKDDDTYYDCVNRGGIWVKGDSMQHFNEIVGCVESEEKKQ